MSDHCVWDYSRQPNQLRCLHCGYQEALTFPMTIRQLSVIAESFSAEHRHCRPAPTVNP